MNLRLRMLRSILTALGIILGVAAVITNGSLGEGSKRQALLEIEKLGARNIIVRSQPPPESANQGGQQRAMINRYGLTRDTLAVVQENFPDAASIVPLKAVGGQVMRLERRKTSQAFGTTPQMLEVANLRVSRGRYLQQADLDEEARVAVVGAEIARLFFPLEDPLGQTMQVDLKPFTVVGVLAPVGYAGGAGAAQIGRDFNLDVHMPLTTARSAFGDIVLRSSSGSMQATGVQITEIMVQSPTRERVLSDAARLVRILETRHPGMIDLEVIVPYELLETAKRQARRFNLVFGAVAGISLLVGGIGIMNIMLASVTERTREIGIRRAIGATRRHILVQFLVETGVLSAIGGLVGVGLGVGLSVSIPWITRHAADIPFIGDSLRGEPLPSQVTLWSILLSFLVATATGLVFGIYPARRAAAQDPIVALRHD